MIEITGSCGATVKAKPELAGRAIRCPACFADLAVAGPAPPASPEAAPAGGSGGVPGWQLGDGDHTPASVTFATLATSANQLSTPRDLAFNPLVPDELWIVNGGTSSVLIVHNASTPSPTYTWRQDSNAMHFMPNPSALAFGGSWTSFGVPGTWATSAESNNGGNNFMGPSLWSSNLSIFAVQNPYGLGSHLDMLHCSPYAMGIAWEKDNVYWVFGNTYSGGVYTADICRYDFVVDHNVGQDDHSDGIKHHYVSGQVKRSAGVMRIDR